MLASVKVGLRHFEIMRLLVIGVDLLKMCFFETDVLARSIDIIEYC